jgi:hypothetical protein
VKREDTARAIGRIAPLPASETTSAAERDLVRLLARQAAAEYVAALRTERDVV